MKKKKWRKNKYVKFVLKIQNKMKYKYPNVIVLAVMIVFQLIYKVKSRKDRFYLLNAQYAGVF